MKIKTAAALLFGFLAPLSAVSATDVHPIIEIETGYFFGGSESGKWIKANRAAKSTGKKTTYQVYSLTKQEGQITASKPKSVDEPCPDTLMVSLSSKSKDGVIGLAATWNALPRKPVIAECYSVSLRGDSPRFLESARNRGSQSANYTHPSRRFGW